jgi:hypothetical protein
MKSVLTFSVLLVSFTSAHAQVTETLDGIASVFEKNLRPYFEKFVRDQYPPDQPPEGQSLLDQSTIALYEQKAKQLNSAKG